MSWCLEYSMCSVNSFWMIALVFFALHWQCQRIFKLPYTTLISHLARFCSKSFKQGFSSTWAENIQMYKVDLEKAKEQEIKFPKFLGSWRKQGNFRKISMSALLTMLKPLSVWITTNCGKFLKRREYQTTLPFPWETCIQVKKQQLEPDMEQLTGSKLGKAYNKAVCCHPAYVTSMQNTSCGMPGWVNHKLKSRLPREISITSDVQMIPL